MGFAPNGIASPSDLAQLKLGTRLSVGGRVGETTRDGCRLNDAFASVLVCFGPPPPQLSEGELLVIDATLDTTTDGQRRLVNAQLRERRANASGAQESILSAILPLGKADRLRQRARALRVVRQFFQARGFLEVETPVRTRHPGTDVFIEPLACADRWLITSPESHMKRLLAAGIPRLFQIARCFRAEELGPLHQVEFSMVEWYRAFADWESVLDDTQQLIGNLAVELRGDASLEFEGRTIDVTPPFERLSVREAFRRYAQVEDAAALAESDEDRYFQVLVDSVEPALARHERAVVLTHYPRSQAALARVSPDDGSVAERFEIYAAGVELCNGYGELTDAEVQRQRFSADVERRQQRGQPHIEMDRPLLSALQAGMPRSAGNALGLDRLIAMAIGADSVGEVQAFPEPLER